MKTVRYLLIALIYLSASANGAMFSAGKFDVQSTSAPTCTGPCYAAYAATSQTVSSTSHVVNMPASIVAGQTLVVFMSCLAAPSLSGWTVINDGVARYLAWKVASGSEGATQTFTTISSKPLYAIAVSVNGGNATTPIDKDGFGTDTTTNKSTATSSAIVAGVWTISTGTGTVAIGDVVSSVTGVGGSVPDGTTIISGTGPWTLSSSFNMTSAADVYTSLPTLSAPTLTPSTGNTNGLLLSFFIRSNSLAALDGGIGTMSTPIGETVISNNSTVGGNGVITAFYKKLSSNSATGAMVSTSSATYNAAQQLSVVITQ